MKTPTKQILSLIAIVVCFLMMGMNKAQAQEKYSFSTWSNFGNSQNEEFLYLYISDPVKNWYDLSEEKRKDWKTNFRISGNKQSGEQLMKSHSEPIPDGGSYERFSSLADCKEAIENKVAKFKKDNSGKKTVKIIYVNLMQYQEVMILNPGGVPIAKDTNDVRPFTF